MALTNEQLNHICLIHQGYKACRYLHYDNKANTFVCAKLNQKLSDEKDIAVYFNEKEAHKINIPVIDFFDLHGLPHSDNCSGYLYLTEKPQGYNI
jgi:hypothetical protein